MFNCDWFLTEYTFWLLFTSKEVNMCHEWVTDATASKYNLLRTALLTSKDSPRIGLIECSLFSYNHPIRAAIWRQYILLIHGFRSEQGSFNFPTTSRFRECLAAISAFSFPCIPMWLGSQQKTMLIEDDRLWCFRRSSWTKELDKFLFFKDCNTDRDSEKIMKFLNLETDIYRKVKSMAWIFAVKI